MTISSGEADADASQFRVRIALLKSQLAKDPEDEGARRELVASYRAARHLDQAGRFGIAIDGLATRTELRAYGAMLRGLGADDNRMRSLSRLPLGTEISTDAREALDAKSDSEGLLSSALPVLWVIVFVAIVVALLATFVTALVGFAATQGVAVVFSIIVIASGVISSVCTGIWAAMQKSWRAAAIWGLIAAALLIVGSLLVPR